VKPVTLRHRRIGSGSGYNPSPGEKNRHMWLRLQYVVLRYAIFFPSNALSFQINSS
jgi:hypothetical protein